MREKEIINVSDGFEKWLETNHLKEKSMGFKISENWQSIVGNTIYHHTDRLDVRVPKLYLKIDNSSLKELLYNDKQLLIDKINNYINSNCIEDIIFT